MSFLLLSSQDDDEIPRVEFDLEKPADIVIMSADFGRLLVERFARNPEGLRTMDRRRFEELVAEIWSGFGYDVELTPRTRDGGRDVIAIAQREAAVKFLIECKRMDPGNAVGVGVVRELYGVKTDEGASKAIVATTTHLSQDAKSFVERNRWELEAREYDGLNDWIRQYAQLRGISYPS